MRKAEEGIDNCVRACVCMCVCVSMQTVVANPLQASSAPATAMPGSPHFARQPSINLPLPTSTHGFYTINTNEPGYGSYTNTSHMQRFGDASQAAANRTAFQAHSHAQVTQQAHMPLAGFMPVAATCTPDLFEMCLQHPQPSVFDDLVPARAPHASEAPMWAADDQFLSSSYSGMPAAKVTFAPGVATAAAGGSSRSAAARRSRLSVDLPINASAHHRAHHSLKRGMSYAGSSTGNPMAAAAAHRGIQRYASVNMGPRTGAGSGGGGGRTSMEFLASRHAPVDATDPGSGDGSSAFPGDAPAMHSAKSAPAFAGWMPTREMGGGAGVGNGAQLLWGGATPAARAFAAREALMREDCMRWEGPKQESGMHGQQGNEGVSAAVMDQQLTLSVSGATHDNTEPQAQPQVRFAYLPCPNTL